MINSHTPNHPAAPSKTAANPPAQSGGAWPSWLPTINTHPETEASEDRVQLEETHFPPWRNAIEAALKENERKDQAHLYASLATIKAFGRPSNRSVFFRGFLSDGIVSQSQEKHHKHKHLSIETPLSNGCIERLSNVLVFAVDVRSGSVEDLIHGSKFGEICWIFPESREQFRLSGQLHLVVSPNHPLALSHQVPTPFSFSSHFPQLDWEQTRKDVWRKISSVRRASFTWPTTHHDVARAGGAGFHHHHHGIHHHHGHRHTNEKPIVGGAIATILSSPEGLTPTLVTSIPVSDRNNSSSSESSPPLTSHVTTEPETINPSTPATTETTARPVDSMGSITSEVDVHSLAFDNFALLLLDVDGADHVQMATAPHARIKYRRSIDAVDHDVPAPEVTPGKVERVLGTSDSQFSIETVVEGGVTGHVGSVDGLVKKVARWSVRDVLQDS